MNHALLVGVNEYQKQPHLAGCVNDVEDIKRCLVDSKVLPASQVQVLLDKDATRGRILEALSALVARLVPGDVGYFHFSGHGVSLPSNDPNEPDGLDETLCPTEFDWSAATAITDNDILEVLRSLKAGARFTISIDSCHSGHFADERAITRRGAGPIVAPRTLVPPQELRSQLRSSEGRRAGLARLRRLANVSFVSACLPTETAADASFNGRGNGAFTYCFLRQVRSTPAWSLADTVDTIASDLYDYEMTPVAEGDTLRSYLEPSAATKRETSLPGVGRLRSTALRAATVVFQQTWSFNCYGAAVSLAFGIAAENGELVASGLLQGLGRPVQVPRIRFGGNQQANISLGILGLNLEVRVSDWTRVPSGLQFRLRLRLTSGIPFVPAVDIADVPVVVPRETFRRVSSAPTSAADLLAAINLNQIAGKRGEHNASARSVDVGSSVRGYRDPWLQVFAAGVAKWGPNWREDRVIRPFQEDNRPRPDGIRRHAVEIGPQRGAGNVYVVGWLSAQESDFDFVLHMGNGFFDGWGEIDWRVVGYNADISPFPRAPEKSPTNGHGRSLPSLNGVADAE